MKTFEKIKDLTNIFAGVCAIYLAITSFIDLGWWTLLFPFISGLIFFYFAGLATFHIMRGLPKAKSLHLFSLIMSLIFDVILLIPSFFNGFCNSIEKLGEVFENPSNVQLSIEVFVGSAFILLMFFSTLSILLEIVYSFLKLRNVKFGEINILNIVIKVTALTGCAISVFAAFTELNAFGSPYSFILFGILIITLMLMVLSNGIESRGQFALALFFMTVVFFVWFYLDISHLKYYGLENQPIYKPWFAAWICESVILPIIITLNVISFFKSYSDKNKTQKESKQNIYSPNNS